MNLVIDHDITAEPVSTQGITFSDEQNRAIDAIVEWYGSDRMEMYVAGFAGVGKSTVVKEAIRRIKAKYGITNVPTGAYTGKAAFVLRKKGNFNAQTIHSMIYVAVQDEKTGIVTFQLNLLGPAALAELIVLDEVSMVSKEMAGDLRKFGKKLLVMGDPGQLPPVNGEGDFTNKEPDIFLKEIHRQAADSPIIELATMARNGIPLPLGYSKDGVKVLPLTNTTQEYIFDPNTQILCGVNRIRWAVTQMMRERLGFTGPVPLPGEKILCKKNNKDLGIFNGGAGILEKLDIREMDNSYILTGQIEDRLIKKVVTDPYLFNQHFDNGASQKEWKKKRQEFDWAYIWSVHSAQGSGWPHVTLLDNSSSFREEKAKHLYTGITRAESGLIILV